MQLKRYGDLENPIKISPRYRDVTRQAIKDQRNIVNQMFCLGVNYYEDYIKHAIRTVKTRVFTDIEIDKIAGLNTNINHNDNTFLQNNLKDRFGELYPEKIDNSNLKQPLKILSSKDNNQDSNNNDGIHAKSRGVNKSNGQNKMCRKVSSCFNKSLCDEANKKVNKMYRTKLKKAEFKIYNSSRYHNPSNGSDKNLKFPIYFNNYLDPFIHGDYEKNLNYSSTLFRADHFKIDNEDIITKQSNIGHIKDDFINLNSRQNYPSKNIEYINSRRKMDKKESQVSKLGSQSSAKLHKSPLQRITLKSNHVKSDNDLVMIKSNASTTGSLKKNKKKNFKYGILSDSNKKLKMDTKVDRKDKFGNILNRVKEMSSRVSFSSENLNTHKKFRISTISYKNKIIDDIINYSMFLHHTLVEFNSFELQTATLIETTPELELSHGSFIIVLIQQIQCSANIRPLIIIEYCFLIPEKVDPTFCNLSIAIETVTDYLNVSYTEKYNNLIDNTKLFNKSLFKIDEPTIEGQFCSNSLCQVKIAAPKIRDPCNICWNFPFEDSWDEISATNHSTSSNETQATKDYRELNLENDEVCATSDEQCGSDLEDEDVFCDNDGGSLKLTDDLSCLSDIVVAPYLTTNHRNYRNHQITNEFTFDDNEEEEEEANHQLSNVCYIDEYELNVCQQASLIFNWQSEIRCGFIGLQTDGIINLPVIVTVASFNGQPFVGGIIVSKTLFEHQANERRVLTRRLSKGYLGDSDDDPSSISSIKSKSEPYIETITKPTISREGNHVLYQSVDLHEQIFDNINQIPVEQNKSVSVHWQPYGGHQKSIVNVKDNLKIRICSPIKYSHHNNYVYINQDPLPLISNSISDGQWNIISGDFSTSNSNNKVDVDDTQGSSSSPEYSVSNTLICHNSDSPETSISQDSSNYFNSTY